MSLKTLELYISGGICCHFLNSDTTNYAGKNRQNSHGILFLFEGGPPQIRSILRLCSCQSVCTMLTIFSCWSLILPMHSLVGGLDPWLSLSEALNWNHQIAVENSLEEYSSVRHDPLWSSWRTCDCYSLYMLDRPPLCYHHNKHRAHRT